MIAPEEAALTSRLNPIYLEGRPLQLEEPAARALGLKDGQIVQASIELRGDTLKMLLNGSLVELPPGLRFSPGDQIWLSVHARAAGWLLKPVDPRAANSPVNSTSSSASPAPAANINNSRLLALSLRPPMTPTLMSLFQPATLNALMRTVGSPELASAFQQMQLYTTGLNAQSLQAAVQNSGFWLEGMLFRGQTVPNTDTKALLRRMIRGMGESESSAKSSLEKAVDDVEAAQVESVAAQSRGELDFSMVLPFADTDPVEIRFFRPARRPGEPPPPFTVDIHTNNEHLGEIWLKTSVSRASHVELIMWAVREDVANLARTHTTALAKRLDQVGLTMDSLRVFNSARPSLPESWTPPGSMLDISA
jgi:hypothetical protein